MNRAIPLWIIVGAMLSASAAQAQPEPEPEDLQQQLTEAVLDGNETALLQLIRKSAGRQELFALSDDSFVFEMKAAETLAALTPKSAADRKLIRQTELSLLHQTDNEGVVQDLLLGLLRSEVDEDTDPSVAIALADALYEAGCDDASPHSEGPTVYLDFHREAESLGDAIGSAVKDVARAGFSVARVEVEPPND